MTIQKFQGRTDFICDDCGAQEEVAPEDGLTFKEAWERVKADGWRTRQNESDGAWEHFCPQCVAAFRADEANAARQTALRRRPPNHQDTDR